MNQRRYGYSVYALVGALLGAGVIFGHQLSLTPTVVGAVVGALFGAALRDW